MKNVKANIAGMLLLAFFMSGCCIKDVKLDLSKAKENKKIFCYAGSLELKGGTPAGGTYSGKGVDDNKFYPQEVGNGKHKITYSVGWFSSASDYIEVFGAMDCEHCSDKMIITCPECKGADLPAKACPACNATGKVKCKTCNGTGKVKRTWWWGEKLCKDCNNGDGYVRCSGCDPTTHKVPACNKCKGNKKIPCPYHSKNGK